MKNYSKHYFEDRDYLDPVIATTIKNLAREKNLKTILDVGCGTGRLVKFLNRAGCQTLGCDISPEAVSLARKINGTKNIYLSPAQNLSFKNDSFDLITAISVIEHMSAKNLSLFLADAKRVLKSNGYIFLITPNYASPLRFILGKSWFAYQDPTHINFYSPDSLEKLLQKYDFKNFKYHFKINWQESLEREFPGITSQLPTFIKKFLVFLFFNSPLAIIRNSFWLSAQKK